MTTQQEEDAIKELETMMLSYCTPMTREEWERNMAIYNRVWDEVVGNVKSPSE
ncbi:hypothetical protein [Spirosoma sp.]|uniref:hypothetical protein n=1 Tax=Spirosoma sp. TaxID=1899569 RepID=UPI00260E8F0B|nr:hypothetical protein [Spirosoma sp.]MCX6213518.1 hypothetical protein [Spirosoma sp.]